MLIQKKSINAKKLDRFEGGTYKIAKKRDNFPRHYCRDLHVARRLVLPHHVHHLRDDLHLVRVERQAQVLRLDCDVLKGILRKNDGTGKLNEMFCFIRWNGAHPLIILMGAYLHD